MDMNDLLNSPIITYTAAIVGGALIGYVYKGVKSYGRIKATTNQIDSLVEELELVQKNMPSEEIIIKQLEVDRLKAETDFKKADFAVDLEKIANENKERERTVALQEREKARVYDVAEAEKKFERQLVLDKASQEAKEKEREFRLKFMSGITELKEQLKTYLDSFKTNGVDSEYINEREQYRKALVDDFIAKLHDDYLLIADEFCVSDEDRERIDGIVDFKFPLNRKKQIQIPKELKTLIELLGSTN